ncbi:hypothetical protein M9Y10_009129 [Tritrichomonas musculus]|uniref:Uncharacterized protein n=1 Tax=Tritrichomonas musculus TaxID=1915356 RepID=A0ABR2J0Z5_9EUKA
MSIGIMPNMYTTTYRSYFTPHQVSSGDAGRENLNRRNTKSLYSSGNSSSPQNQQEQQPTDTSNARLPPLNPRSASAQSNEKQLNTNPNVQRSGFWCENHVVDHQAKYEMKTTNQEAFGQPTLDKNNSKRNKNGKYSLFPSNAMSPYVREPILIPSNYTSQNNAVDDTYTTTMQKSYPKYEVSPASIPSNVSMATTGFQRGSDGSVSIKSGTSAPKMTKNEIERLRYRDPIAYLDAQNDDNPYISINQLCYQVPVRPKPF